MRKTLLLLVFITTALLSFGQEDKSTPVEVSQEPEKSETESNTGIQTPLAASKLQYLDSRYDYVDPGGHKLTIENSYPKGGLQYTDSSGKEYVYTVFWTRITNGTEKPFELAMEFPVGSYELPSSPGRFFKILIPSDTITPDKEPLFNYGLDLEEYLNHNLCKQAEIKRIINPQGSTGFYVVTLFNKGIEGALRAGLSIKEQKLFYRINDLIIQCGEVDLKQFKQQ